LARKFLYLIAIIIVLTIAALFNYRLFGVQMMRMALVPSAQFAEGSALSAADYRSAKLWIARPDIPENPALWVPPGEAPVSGERAAAVFYIHPTSYINRSAWNAPLDDVDANRYATLFLRGQATAFNAIGDIWAPHYRQATFGAFLTSADKANEALDFAYRDVAAAFDAFLSDVGPARPIILVGHSQGALHLARLLRERVAGTPLVGRIVAAYAVGWPISRTTDLPLMGLHECAGPDDIGCILSWQSFAEPADPAMVAGIYDESVGFNGKPRKGTPMICTNPVTGKPDSDAPASANLGTLVPTGDMSGATLMPGMIAARCSPDGFLLIGPPPGDIGRYVLPGNNYHVFDYSLFWANVRADVARRLSAFQAARAKK